jgi:hypothetical protein
MMADLIQQRNKEHIYVHGRRAKLKHLGHAEFKQCFQVFLAFEYHIPDYHS